jgi:hypothetical protein
MTSYPRAELEAMVERWLQANRDAEASGDWRSLADCFTEDATYGWNFGPKEHFMAVGRDEIRDIALGQEMGGLSGWQYPYEEMIIDETKGHVVGFWRQVGRRHPRGRLVLRGARHRRQLVRLRRRPAVGLSARLVRLRQRRLAVPGDDG